MRVPPGTLHESTALDDMLDGVAAAKDRMEAAKAKIQQVLDSFKTLRLCPSAIRELTARVWE